MDDVGYGHENQGPVRAPGKRKRTGKRIQRGPPERARKVGEAPLVMPLGGGQLTCEATESALGCQWENLGLPLTVAARVRHARKA